MSEATPRFRLPFIMPGQAQKELFHNESLMRVDAALHPAVEEAPRHQVPSAPEVGQCWLVAEAASGAWLGRDGALAAWTEGGWRFVAPVLGMLVWNKASESWLHWRGDAWSGGELHATAYYIGGKKVVGERQPAVPSPSGGTIIDQEARSAIAALTATLKSHGLIE